MQQRIALIRLPILILVLFFVGKLIVGAAGGDYSLGVRLFAMVPVTIHLCIIWGALSRSVWGQGAKSAMMTGMTIALVAQVLIVVGTFFSYILGIETAYNNSYAIVNEMRPVGFAEAMGARTVGLVVNAILGAIAAGIGYALGRFLPASAD